MSQIQFRQPRKYRRPFNPGVYGIKFPLKLNVFVPGFGSVDGQRMVYEFGSNPASYTKDLSKPTEYFFCDLELQFDKDWSLTVINGTFLNGIRQPVNPANPVGEYPDISGQNPGVTAVVTSR